MSYTTSANDLGPVVFEFERNSEKTRALLTVILPLIDVANAFDASGISGGPKSNSCSIRYLRKSALDALLPGTTLIATRYTTGENHA
jgi:hypothetical protein